MTFPNCLATYELHFHAFPFPSTTKTSDIDPGDFVNYYFTYSFTNHDYLSVHVKVSLTAPLLNKNFN